jgi:hypothetical protein
MTENFEYDFECLNHMDYQCKIILKAKGSLMGKLFRMAKVALKRKHNIEVAGEIDKVDRIEIPDNMKKLTGIYIRKTYHIVKRIVGEDGIKLLNYELIKGDFIKKDSDWDIELTIGGQYVR